MRIATLFLAASLAFGSVASVRAASPTPIPFPTANPLVYGQYPIAYQVLIERWLETKLTDPKSAVIEWLGEPKAGEYKTQKGQRYVGYVIDFKVNARNQFGGYTGKQLYRVVIKNGDVLWGGHPRH